MFKKVISKFHNTDTLIDAGLDDWFEINKDKIIKVTPHNNKWGNNSNHPDDEFTDNDVWVTDEEIYIPSSLLESHNIINRITRVNEFELDKHKMLLQGVLANKESNSQEDIEALQNLIKDLEDISLATLNAFNKFQNVNK